MSGQNMSLVAAQAGGIGKALAPFREALARSQASFAEALPATVRKYLTPERLTKITLAAISRSPQLLECTPESVLRSVMDAAALGLEPGGPLGQAYLVPFRNKGKPEAQLIIGYRGLITLARRSGEIESVASNIVFARDRFRCDLATGTLEHEPFFAELPDGASQMSDDDIDAACDRGKPVAVYCVAKFVGGGQHVDVMTMADCEKIRRRSQSGAKNEGPWGSDYLEMCRKSCVRRSAKYWPLSIELADAMERDDQRAVEVPAPQPARMGFGRQIAAPAQEPPHDAQTGEVRDEAPSQVEHFGPDVPDFDSGEPVEVRQPSKQAGSQKLSDKLERLQRKTQREPGEEG